MRCRIPVVVVAATAVLALLSTTEPASAAGGNAAAQAAAAAAAKPDQKVIVVLKDQPAAATPGTAAASRRSQAIASAQAPVIQSLGSKASHVKGFRTADAFAATIPAATMAALQSDPAVAAVVPDAVIRTSAAASSGTRPSGTSGGSAADVCSTTAQYDESATAVRAVSDDRTAVTARSLGYTGAGVKVAWLADGVDIHNVNFLRDPSDPSSTVFSDYQDFTGDGTDAPTAGGEAFLDANAIAGQGTHVYDVNGFGTTPLAGPCNVRIQGVAPGASLVGLKIFSNAGVATTSGILQAIDYAVLQDHVNVINESFGGNPIPDTTADVIRQFDDFAVAAGVTVTTSTGDSGPFDTQGSPSTDPRLIAVGASTTFRFYEQTNENAARVLGPKGWLNDNISAISSSGQSENDSVPNVVAPGDLSWASCTASDQYSDCVDESGNPSDIEGSGGTSESSPLTAGTAALVIEAYAKSHGGRLPSPALVKRIITSTARDLQAPADEQGSGLVDAAAAVRLAASTGGSASGDTLLKSVDQLSATDAPGSAERFAVMLTNEGARAQQVRLSARTLGAQQAVASGSVTLADTNPKVADGLGRTDNVQAVPFRVPAGQARLFGSYSYTADPTGKHPRVVRLAFVDPEGRFAAFSIPQGPGNHGTAEVEHPEPGRWTAYLYSPQTADLGTTGAVPYRFVVQQAVATGDVQPAVVSLQAGASRTVQVTVRTPSTPGDAADSLVLDSDRAGTTTVPILLRSAIDVASGGRFSGTLTSGNGRGGAEQEAFYTFHVPSGVRNVTADLTLANDPADPVGLFLIGPNGDTEGYGQNTAGGSPTLSATAWTLKPTPGDWTLAVAFATPPVGDEVADAYRGSVRFDDVRASAKGLPSDPSVTLTAGTAVVVPVRFTNNGAAPAQVFVDARTAGSTLLPLAGLAPTTGLPVPTDGENIPLWFVPTETTRFVAAATSSLPIEFDTGLGFADGDPDVESRPITGGSGCATTEVATYAAGDRTIGSGAWLAQPSECGPYAGAAPAGTVDFAAIAVTRGFDDSVTTPTGDAELTAIDPSTEVDPLIVAPGATVVIPVTITPTGASGTTVRGDLFVDALTDDVPPYDQFTGDELASLPYAYTIK